MDNQDVEAQKSQNYVKKSVKWMYIHFSTQAAPAR